jgi:hypothetical protein
MLPATTLKRNGVGPLPPEDAISASYCWLSWPSPRTQTLLLRVPPSEAQFADPESLSGVLLVVVVAVVVPVVAVVVVLVVGFGFAPARDTPNASAKPEATSTKSEPTSAAAASVLFIRLNLRIVLLSVVRATLRAPQIHPARLNGLTAYPGWAAVRVARRAFLNAIRPLANWSRAGG